MPATKTQPLPTNWHWTQDVAPSPRPRARSESMAVTNQLPVIGRAGTRERVLASDACFGGGEVR